ncbi:MAG: hypothetical protein H0S79_24725 [Anaerolineaceae bacterium]|nr:hypothetical protein [Anaerolineaceae bacterium]
MITHLKSKKTVITYLVITLFCVAFNYLYSLFGHGVSSPFMSYAFVFSFILGVVGYVIIGRLNLENRLAFNLYNAGIATLTVGSLLRGILDIAGADSTYPIYYFVVGTLFVLIGSLLFFYQWTLTRRNELGMS